MARGACRVSAHDPCERLSRCVLVVPGFTWEIRAVLDNSLEPEMLSRDVWRSCSRKRQKMQKMLSVRQVTAEPVCEVTAEPVCEVTAEQAHGSAHR